MCREARVARNVRVADMNVQVPVTDGRRIEVVANGLSRWHGAQLALDATIVTRSGDPHPRAKLSLLLGLALSLAPPSDVVAGVSFPFSFTLVVPQATRGMLGLASTSRILGSRQRQAKLDKHPRADTQPGWAVVDSAAWCKRRDTYPELTRARRCRLVVVGVAVGGRFGPPCRRTSDRLRRPWVARWAALLAVASQRA